MKEFTVTYTHSSDSASTFMFLEKQIEFEKEVQKVRIDMVKKYGRESDISSSYLEDLYYRTLYSHGIKFNKRKFSLENILKVSNKNLRDYLKIFMALSGSTFSIVRKRNERFATE
jgi:hypothetical protein